MAHANRYQGSGWLGWCARTPVTIAASAETTNRGWRVFCAACDGSTKYTLVARTPSSRYMCHARNPPPDIPFLPSTGARISPSGCRPAQQSELLPFSSYPPFARDPLTRRGFLSVSCPHLYGSIRKAVFRTQFSHTSYKGSFSERHKLLCSAHF